MSNEIKSEGKCFFCNDSISVGSIGTHLAKHLNKIGDNILEQTKSFNHIHIYSKYDKNMFLHLLVDSKAKFELIDDFLRDIWLECCGHLSGFRFKSDEIKMNKKVGDVFLVVDKIDYDYDYGTTTSLIIKGLKTYKLPYIDQNLILLSRNEPLELICSNCELLPAEKMCSACCDQFGFLLLCKKCDKKHKKTCEDYDDYAELNIVNSPRCGECGYIGGGIDLERDGFYKLKK